MADRDRPELGPRKSAVLRAVVEQYVRSGEPVGSETIAEAAGLGVSSATIRNEMAALEEQGYLRHPHTSAGRIPTDAGYRHYVDSLPAGGKLRDAQRRLIAGYFTEAIVDLEEVRSFRASIASRNVQGAAVKTLPFIKIDYSLTLVDGVFAPVDRPAGKNKPAPAPSNTWATRTLAYPSAIAAATAPAAVTIVLHRITVIADHRRSATPLTMLNTAIASARAPNAMPRSVRRFRFRRP